jgi:hypothetical protein
MKICVVCLLWPGAAGLLPGMDGDALKIGLRS